MLLGHLEREREIMFSTEVSKMCKDENEKYSHRLLQAPPFSNSDQFQREDF